MTRLESARMKTPRGSDPKILYLRLVLGSIPPKDRYFGGGHGHFCLESGLKMAYIIAFWRFKKL